MRQGRAGRLAAEIVPMGGGGRVRRGHEVVAKRGAERQLQAFEHGNVVDQGLARVAAIMVEGSGQRGGLRGGALARHLGLAQGLARAALGGLGGRTGALSRAETLLAFLQGGVGSRHPLTGGGKRRLGFAKRRGVGKPRGDGSPLRRHLVVLGVERGEAGLELVLAAGKIGVAHFSSRQRRGTLSKFAVDGLQRCALLLQALSGLFLLAAGACGILFEARCFLTKLAQRSFGFRRQGAFARQVAAQGFELRLALGSGRGKAALLVGDGFAFDLQTVQRGGGLGLDTTQLRQAFGDTCLQRGRFGRHARGLGHVVLDLGHGRLGRSQIVARLLPTAIEQCRLGLAQAPAQGAVARRLAGLALERLHLRFERRDDVLEAVEIGLRCAQPQLRLVTARVQAGNARRFLQQMPPLGRLGADELADLALADQGRGTGTAGRVGKQDLHVSGAHVAAVDAIVGARAALDAARDFELGMLVIGGRRVALGVVEHQRHLGQVARRALGGAGKNDVVHLAAANLLGGGLAHDPAQRLDQV